MRMPFRYVAPSIAASMNKTPSISIMIACLFKLLVYFFYYSFHQALCSSWSVSSRVAALHFKTEDEYFAMNSDMDGKIPCGMWINLAIFLFCFIESTTHSNILSRVKFFPVYILYFIKVSSNECQIEIKLKQLTINRKKDENLYFFQM